MTDAPKLNRYGHPVGPEFTQDMRAKARVLAAEGKGPEAIRREVGCTIGQARAVYADKQRFDLKGIASLFTTIIDKQDRCLEAMSLVGKSMTMINRRMSQLEEDNRILRKAAERRKLELFGARMDRTKLRKERVELIKALHRATGRTWGKP